MKNYVIVLIVIAIFVIGYILFPKYQIISNSGSIYKLNKLTGQVTREYNPIKKPTILLKP